MPIVIHLGSSGTLGRRKVRVFLNEVVSAAPEIPIQIAHMSSAPQRPKPLREFADARATGGPLAAISISTFPLAPFRIFKKR